MNRSHIEDLHDDGNLAAACEDEDALRVTGLEAWYGESHILHGVDLRAARGEVVTLLGRNGSGRSTTLKAIMGLTDTRSGSVRIDGRETIGRQPQDVARLGKFSSDRSVTDYARDIWHIGKYEQSGRTAKAAVRAAVAEKPQAEPSRAPEAAAEAAEEKQVAD